jgi:hypothetical protein
MSVTDGEALRASMPFNVATQHSPEYLSRLEETARLGQFLRKNALITIEALLANVHPAAPKFIEFLQSESSHSDVQNYVRTMLTAFDKMRNVFRLERLSEKDRKIFYSLDDPVFMRRQESSKLLVVFSTMYNNFYFSNAATVSFLSQLNCNMLLLKDSSQFNYLYGAKGFGNSLFEIGGAIVALAERHGLDHIYVCGFSSSGYAALYTSLTIPCRGYLGFSHSIDLSTNSPLPPPRFFTDEVRAKVDPATLLDLRGHLIEADPSVDRQFHYSKLDWREAPHGEYVAGLNTIAAMGSSDAGHNLIAPMLAAGTLLPAFVRLTSG